MSCKIDDRALDTLFRQARTFAKWQDRPVSDDTLRRCTNSSSGTTSANAEPARFAFLRTKKRRNAFGRRWRL